MKLLNKKQAVAALFLVALTTGTVSAAETKSEPTFTTWIAKFFSVRSGHGNGDPK